MDNDGPRNVLAQGHLTLRFNAVAATTTRTVPGAARKDQPVEKLRAPRLTIHGAGEKVELTSGTDYTKRHNGNDEATFTLTEKGMATLARLKALDSATTVQTWVPARANTTQPWGSGPVRNATLGDLAATDAGVIGITGLAVLLIILGLILRRRNGDEE